MNNKTLLEKKIKFPHLTLLFEELQLQFQQKLWHETTENLFKLIKDPEVLNNGADLLEIYFNFIVSFEKYMEEIKLVKIYNLLTNFLSGDEERVQFITEREQILKDNQAKLVTKLLKGIYNLKLGLVEQGFEVYTQVRQVISKLINIEPIVLSLMHQIAYLYHGQKGNHEEFYKNALQYLCYTSEEDIMAQDKINLSFQMAVSILISPKIYNYNELLEQPVLQSLKTSPAKWVYSLLQTFNSGDVDRFYADISNLKNEIAENKLLAQNSQILEEQIKIMAFLELIFELPKNKRIVDFKAIADKCQFPQTDVELLLIRAMNLELIKGEIDEIQKKVYIDWIIPRFMNKARVGTLLRQFEEWNKDIDSSLKKIEDECQNIEQDKK